MNMLFSYNYEARHNQQKPDNNGQQPCWIQSWREELQDANEKKTWNTTSNKIDRGITSSWYTATNTIEVSAYGSVCVSCI